MISNSKKQDNFNEYFNNYKEINNGGTHEENPYGGVQLGIDPEGAPNKLEQNEVTYNDYVYSDRIKFPVQLNKEYNLNNKKEYTFAEVARKTQKNYAERPNDEISRRSLNKKMTELANYQDLIKQQLTNQENQTNQMYNKYEDGGHLNKYAKYGYKRNENGWAYGGLLPNYYSGTKSTYAQTKDGTPLLLAKPENTVSSDYPDLVGYKKTVKDALNSAKNLDQNNSLGTNKRKKGTDSVDYALDTDDYRSNILRKAPILGSAIGLFDNIVRNRNYSRANAIENAARNVLNVKPVSFTPRTTYMQYTPFDYANAITQAQLAAAANRQNLINASGGNRANVTPNLMALNYNTTSGIGDIYEKGYLAAQSSKNEVNKYNQDINSALMNLDSSVSSANQKSMLDARNTYLNGIITAMEAGNKVDSNRDSAIASNMSTLFSSIGDLGKELAIRNMIKSDPTAYYYYDDNNKLVYKPSFYKLDEKDKQTVINNIKNNKNFG